MDHHIPGGGVVKLEDVFNKLLLVSLDGPGLLPLLHHGHDVVLRHLVLSVQQLQNGPPQQLDNIDAKADREQNKPYLALVHENNLL